MAGFQGKTILITGASGAIGQAVANRLQQEGATLYLVTRNEDALPDRLRASSTVITADIKEEEQATAVAQQLPALNGWLNAMGDLPLLPAAALSGKQFDNGVDLNLKTPVSFTARLLKGGKLNAGGSLVFVNTVATQQVFKGGAMYSAAKAGLAAYVKVLALELAEQGIRANTIAAGLVDTPFLEMADNEYLSNMKQRYPLGFGKADDVAGAAAFLLSDDSRWITGSELLVDGGFSMT